MRQQVEARLSSAEPNTGSTSGGVERSRKGRPRPSSRTHTPPSRRRSWRKRASVALVATRRPPSIRRRRDLPARSSVPPGRSGRSRNPTRRRKSPGELLKPALRRRQHPRRRIGGDSEPSPPGATRIAAFCAGVTRIWSRPVFVEVVTHPEHDPAQLLVNTPVLAIGDAALRRRDRSTSCRSGSRTAS